MNHWRRWSLFTLFFLSFAFAGGGLFLLYAMLPLERALVGAEWRQGEIDRLLSIFVVGWFVIAAAAALIYYRATLAPTWRRLPALIAVAMTTAAAVTMFYIFLHTGVAMIASRSSKMEEAAGGKLTFGPYPDRELMIYLKSQGFDGIIALLNRTVPFEGPLLDREIETAHNVGIEMHVLPMLPWVSDNHAALERARELLMSGKRYYVHCYLGQHRTNLIRTLAAQMELAPEFQLGLRPALERGPMYVYENGRVLVGPYPTDEEWVGKILNYGVREVISVVDGDRPENAQWIGKLKKLGETYGLTVVEKPLDSSFPEAKVTGEIAHYAKSRPHKIFIVGFRNGNWTWALDAALGGGGLRIREEVGRDSLERGKLLRAGSLLFGPLPTDEELAVLRRAGINEFISVIDPADPENQRWIEQEQQWAKLYGFKLTQMPLPRRYYSVAQIQTVSDYLQSRTQPVYVHGFTSDVRMEILYRLAKQFPQVTAAAAKETPGQAAPANPADQPQKR